MPAVLRVSGGRGRGEAVLATLGRALVPSDHPLYQWPRFEFRVDPIPQLGPPLVTGSIHMREGPTQSCSRPADSQAGEPPRAVRASLGQWVPRLFPRSKGFLIWRSRSRDYGSGGCARPCSVAINDIVLTAAVALVGTMMSVIGLFILVHLRRIDRRLDRSEERNREDRKAFEERAKEDREVNRAEHGRQFCAIDELRGGVSRIGEDVSDLKADVKVLRDRSDRAGPESQNG